MFTQSRVMWSFFFLVVLILEAGSGYSLSNNHQEEIDAFIEAIMECAGMPGLSVSAVQNGETVLSKGYGKANIEEDIDLDENTLMNIASVTKAFTGFLLALQLSETSNGYDWDTPVREILGDSFYFINGYYSNQTSLKDLLAHKTGFPRHDFTRFFNVFSREELMERVRFVKPAYPFRTQFTYNNLMYMVAGVASSALADDATWEELIKERLFDPIGMATASFIKDAPSDYEGFAVPYVRRTLSGPLETVPAEFFNHYRSAGPAGGIAASAQDIAMWMQFLLNEATTQDGDQLLSSEEYRSYMAPEFALGQLLPPWFPSMPISYRPAEKYGKGWNTGLYKGLNLINHGGGMLGISTLLYLLPEVNLGVYVGVNGEDYGITYLLLPFILDVLMGDEPWVSSDLICSLVPMLEDNHYNKKDSARQTNRNEDQVTEQERLSNRLQDYEGDFGNFLYGNMTVALVEGNEALELIFGTNGLYELVPTEDQNVFLLDGKNLVSSVYSLGHIVFESSQGNGEIDTFILPETEPFDPPVFTRGLNFEDAPPPDISNCI